jgi:nucleotide-binding universal stress UspA family protein
LREAATIKIVSIKSDPNSVISSSAMVAHLKRLGIAATVDTTTDLRLPIEDDIFSRVDWEGVDLLLEHVFGGVSRTLLHQMMVPVLVSH